MDPKPIPILSTDELSLQSRPPVESFFDSDQAAALWPRDITAQPDFRTQTLMIQALVDSVETVFATLPIGLNLAEGLNAGLIPEAAARHLLLQLTHYLQLEKAYERIVFYLPFELTSPITNGLDSLTLASLRFHDAYRAAWEAQSKQHDVRANFVDGDVLEIDKRRGDVTRVVKATHLIPGLIKSGHLTFREVLAYAEKSSDELFKRGVLEACAVLLDTKQIEQSDLESVLHSPDPYLAHGHAQLLWQQQKFAPSRTRTQADIIAALREAIASTESLERKGVTPNRLKWLRSREREQAIMSGAKWLSLSLLENAPLPKPERLDSSVAEAYIEAVRLVMVQKHQLSNEHSEWLAAVEQIPWSTTAVRDATLKIYRHAYTTCILPTKDASQHGIHLPTLAGPFSQNLANFTPGVTTFQTMIAEMSEDAYLCTRVYPVVILFGSQLKGYGSENSDADVAVLITPGTSDDDRNEIASRLCHIFAHERIGGSIIMFWLGTRGHKLVVQKTTQTTDAPALSTWVHVLMGGSWVGDTACLNHLQHELLVPYLGNPTETRDGKPLRERWLEEMERDSILYRLLHKGFERYYPIESPFDTPNGSAIDGSSAFYDPTFRRIATTLFLTRVYIPNLE